MTTINEWDQLKRVIVGVADYAIIPELDKSLRTINYANIDDESIIKVGSYPQQVIDEANEDLEIFSNFLKYQNIEVLRPIREKTLYYNYCPRDCVLVHGDLNIATPMPLRSRLGNWKSFGHHLNNVIDISCDYDDRLYNTDCFNNKDILALTEFSPAFDAANIIRANDQLLYLVSNSGNISGANLLQDILGKEVKVNLLQNVYSYIHIDSTIAFLREGLMLINPERIKSIDVLPEPFRNWDVIWCPEPVDIGYYSPYNNASKWINMNLFSINSNLVVLEVNQNNLRIELEKHNIDCAMLPMRHQRTLGGGFHCVTLDLERD